MATHKLTGEQQRRVDEIQAFQHTVDVVKHLVAELDVGTIGDVAGAMSVMAGRGGGINMKIRGLTDGVNSLGMQLEMALKQALTPEEPKKPA